MRLAWPDRIYLGLCACSTPLVNRWADDETTAYHRLICYIHASNDRILLGGGR